MLVCSIQVCQVEVITTWNYLLLVPDGVYLLPTCSVLLCLQRRSYYANNTILKPITTTTRLITHFTHPYTPPPYSRYVAGTLYLFCVAPVHSVYFVFCKRLRLLFFVFITIHNQLTATTPPTHRVIHTSIYI